MSEFLGHPTIVVNVASQWGVTDREYTQLQAGFEKQDLFFFDEYIYLSLDSNLSILSATI